MYDMIHQKRNVVKTAIFFRQIKYVIVYAVHILLFKCGKRN